MPAFARRASRSNCRLAPNIKTANCMLFPFLAPPAIKNNEEAALNVLFSVFEMKGMRQFPLIWQSDS
jgi:hypothetical protein